MIAADLAHETDFGGWRDAARALAMAGIAPEAVTWRLPGHGGDLFDVRSLTDLPPPGDAPRLSVPKDFIATAERVICHRDPARFARLYRLLWRQQRERHLLANAADDDVAWAQACDKAIRRDRHKMHAFVRFRKVGERTDLSHTTREQFAAWFEPEHRITELAAPFFQRRFANMDWAIVTPEKTAIWDGETLSFAPGGTRADVPDEDAVEDQWRTYFASIFNPARLKTKAMTAEMPKKYWRNLPEASLIPELINSAQMRTRAMEETAVSSPGKLARIVAKRPEETADIRAAAKSLDAAAKAVQHCTRCPLYHNASQAVFGEGPRDAPLMIVGEQPGDQEDIAGKPFVGPAGQLLDKALGEAGIDRDAAYVTNAVKHFKFEQRGRRRQHAKPSASEIDHCNVWIEIERKLIKPRVIVMLGATAARGIMGKTMKIGENRGRSIALEDEASGLITVHPSYLLRLRGGEAEKQAEYQRFVTDLSMARDWLGRLAA